MNSKSPSKGFTLLEVLISIVILAFISLAVFQIMSKTYELRDILLVEGEFHSEIRLSMGILERDITLMYSPLLMLPPKKSAAQAQPPQQPGGAPAESAVNAITEADRERYFTYWMGIMDDTGLRATRFIGERDRLSFVASSHTRVYKDSRESVFAKVAYELRADEFQEALEADAKAQGREPQKTQMLVKLVNTDVFDYEEENEKTARTYALLHGVTGLKFRYYHREKDQWQDTWDSAKPEFRNIFPDVIEIQIKVIGPERQNFEGVFKYRPEIPLNGLTSST